MANLLHGSGSRLMKCARLRVKFVDFGYKQIIVRDGKGNVDRWTMLPEILIPKLVVHINNSFANNSFHWISQTARNH